MKTQTIGDETKVLMAMIGGQYVCCLNESHFADVEEFFSILKDTSCNPSLDPIRRVRDEFRVLFFLKMVVVDDGAQYNIHTERADKIYMVWQTEAGDYCAQLEDDSEHEDLVGDAADIADALLSHATIQ